MGYKFKEVLEKGTERIKGNIDEYKIFLKVMGNNYKYDGINQINIYFLQPNAKACAEFNFWKNNFERVVSQGQKGIPIFSNDNKKVTYIYDVNQTVSLKKEEREINLWSFDIDKHQDILDEIKSAKEEIKKPFLQADILKEKKERLNELNRILDMGTTLDKKDKGLTR